MADTKLVSMKRPKKAANEGDAIPAPMDAEGPQYGWGLQLRLENFELDKLGMKLPAVGQEFRIVAMGKVTSVSESQYSGNKGDRGVQIQITDLAIGKGGEQKES